MSKEIRAALSIVMIVADVIRDLGEVPSGELYANVMGHMSLATYEAIINTLVMAKLVKRDGNHLLRWIGPPKREGQ